MLKERLYDRLPTPSVEKQVPSIDDGNVIGHLHVVAAHESVSDHDVENSLDANSALESETREQSPNRVAFEPRSDADDLAKRLPKMLVCSYVTPRAVEGDGTTSRSPGTVQRATRAAVLRCGARRDRRAACEGSRARRSMVLNALSGRDGRPCFSSVAPALPATHAPAVPADEGRLRPAADAGTCIFSIHDTRKGPGRRPNCRMSP
jgi:hypothetical protein